MSFRINETEKWVGKEALRLAFRSSVSGLKSFITNMLHLKSDFQDTRIACIMLQASDLAFTMSRNPRKIF
ncbi:MAG: hypothetical protein DMG24_01160 [Acidobacteria bacterium]|nr:MAG: hypothetical protein DMG24_01160 [Acidobacteriota bacterium]